MKLRRALATLVVIVGLGFVLAKPCVRSTESSSEQATTKRRAIAISHGSVGGTVRDDSKSPIAGVRVCASGPRDSIDDIVVPICTVTDANGAYELRELASAKYIVTASAVHHAPAHSDFIALPGDAHIDDVDLVLHGGGVEIAGVVIDRGGHPIAHARVTANPLRRGMVPEATITVETETDGRFSLWTERRDHYVVATAEGFSDHGERVTAPDTMELVMTRQATVSGTVVSATTGEPIAAANVYIDAPDFAYGYFQRRTVSDDDGHFHFARLEAGLLRLRAYTDHGEGNGEGSFVVAAGQHVDDVVVRVITMAHVEGRVEIASTGESCAAPSVSLIDVDSPTKTAWLRGDSDDHVSDAVRPGTYEVKVSCRGFVARDDYPRLVVGDEDVTGLVWSVVDGGRIHGHVRTKTGRPVAGFTVRIDREPFNESAATLADGSYEITGLAPGSYELRFAEHRDGPSAEIKASETVEQDIVVDDYGTIRGKVVDGDGLPVAGESVQATGMVETDHGDVVREWATSSPTGELEMRDVPVGTYRVAPYTADTVVVGGDRAPVAVTANNDTIVTVVVDARRGVIRGRVVDAEGKPVSDGYVEMIAQSLASYGDRRQIPTREDGTFVASKLDPTEHVVHAYRKNGSEGMVEHVTPGADVVVKLHEVASLSGTVRGADGNVPAELQIDAQGPRGSQHQVFVGTNGHYAFAALPTGTYRLHCEAGDRTKDVDITLAEGEHKQDFDIELPVLVAVSGRIVDYRTRRPIAHVTVTGGAAGSGGTTKVLAAVTDASGRFALSGVPIGALTIASSTDQDDGYGEATTTVTISGPGELGDIAMVRARAFGDDAVGSTGFHLAYNYSSDPPPAHRVDRVTPESSAARAGLVEGDEIVAVDGIDVTGIDYDRYAAAIAAPPGTQISLRLARGVTVTFALGEP